MFDAELKEDLAVRRVKKSLGDAEDIAKEKQINEELRKVENENILKIYDIVDQPDTVWYITEYCAGGSLWYVLPHAGTPSTSAPRTAWTSATACSACCR